MKKHENEDSYSYTSGEIPQDEEYVPKKKIVIGKQLLLIIQLIVCGAALLFMVLMKLINTGFCRDILSWYETNYYDSIYTSEDGKNNLSIFGGGDRRSESSKAESAVDSSKSEKSESSNEKAGSKSENSKSKNTSA